MPLVVVAATEQLTLRAVDTIVPAVGINLQEGARHRHRQRAGLRRRHRLRPAAHRPLPGGAAPRRGPVRGDARRAAPHRGADPRQRRHRRARRPHPAAVSEQETNRALGGGLRHRCGLRHALGAVRAARRAGRSSAGACSGRSCPGSAARSREGTAVGPARRGRGTPPGVGRRAGHRCCSPAWRSAGWASAPACPRPNSSGPSPRRSTGARDPGPGLPRRHAPSRSPCSPPRRRCRRSPTPPPAVPGVASARPGDGRRRPSPRSTWCSRPSPAPPPRTGRSRRCATRSPPFPAPRRRPPPARTPSGAIVGGTVAATLRLRRGQRPRPAAHPADHPGAGRRACWCCCCAACSRRCCWCSP